MKLNATQQAVLNSLCWWILHDEDTQRAIGPNLIHSLGSLTLVITPTMITEAIQHIYKETTE